MFSKIKRAFGFGREDDELISDDPEITPRANAWTPNRSVGTQRPGTPNVTDDTNLDTGDTGTVKTLLFDHVVAEFNKALPTFLSESVDPERQKEYLLKAMDNDLKAHLAALEEAVSVRIGESWRSEREKLKNDLKQVSETAKDLENKRADLKQQQLSNERQRRALTERVHDLEKRILTLEAEKEQLELETKSLLNKVKVSQVHEKEADELRGQVEYLQSELVKKRTEVSEGGDPAPGITDEVLVLQSEVERLRKVEEDYNTLTSRLGEIDEKMAQVEELTERKDARITSLGEEVARLTKERDRAVAEAEKARAEASRVVAEARRNAADIDADDVAMSRQDTSSEPVDLDADNDLLNDTDWIVNPKGRHSQQKKADSKPRQKKSPRDDGQMSLW